MTETKSLGVFSAFLYLNCFPRFVCEAFVFVSAPYVLGRWSLAGASVSDVTIAVECITVVDALAGPFAIWCTYEVLFTDVSISGAVLESPLELFGNVFNRGLPVALLANVPPFGSS